MTTLVSVLRKLWLWDWLRGRRGRGRQIAALAIYGFFALLVIGAAAPNSKKRASPVAGVRAIAPRPSSQAMGQQQRLPSGTVNRRQTRRVRSQATARSESAAGRRREGPKPRSGAAHAGATRSASSRRTPTARPAPTTTPVSSGSSGDQAACTPGYSPCIPPGSDVDCAGGSGNGPRYVQGPVQVTGSDPYRLDADGDGVGCDS